MSEKIDIRSLKLPELKEKLIALKEKPFRANQIHEWLWKKGAGSFQEMTNLNLQLRERLEQEFSLLPISIAEKQYSNDGTIKYAFSLHDLHAIEGVLIPADERVTACVSSQVGCSLACSFCATGFLPRLRNLTAAEIFDQINLLIKESHTEYGKPLSNVVFMGMGEPLLNYDALLDGIDRVTGEEGIGMSPKRITVSTAGISRKIKQLGDDQVKFNLALSLHAANDKKRSEIMAINDSNSIEKLVEAMVYFYNKTGNKITFEYIAFDKFNDHIEDAKDLVKLCKRVPSKVNIIEYNPVDQVDFKRSEDGRLERFQNYLKQNNVPATLRRSRGKDIDAACGQLANKKS